MYLFTNLHYIMAYTTSARQYSRNTPFVKNSNSGFPFAFRSKSKNFGRICHMRTLRFVLFHAFAVHRQMAVACIFKMLAETKNISAIPLQHVAQPGCYERFCSTPRFGILSETCKAPRGFITSGKPPACHQDQKSYADDAPAECSSISGCSGISSPPYL